jgi:hypothetical protein
MARHLDPNQAEGLGQLHALRQPVAYSSSIGHALALAYQIADLRRMGGLTEIANSLLVGDGPPVQ